MENGQRKNAFQVLLNSNKKKAASPAAAQQPTKRQKSSNSIYVTCPVCARSIPASFLELHTQSCIEKQATQSPAPQPTQPTETDSMQQGGSSDTQAPQGTLNTAAELDQSRGLREDSSALNPAIDLTQATDQAAQPKDNAGVDKKKTGGPSALHVLMQAQREKHQQAQPQHHVFYLDWDDGGTQGSGNSNGRGVWRCYWWRTDPPPKQRHTSAPSSTPGNIHRASSPAPTQPLTSTQPLTGGNPTLNTPQPINLSSNTFQPINLSSPSPNTGQQQQQQSQLQQQQQQSQQQQSQQHINQHTSTSTDPRPCSTPVWSATTVVKEKGEKGAVTTCNLTLQTNTLPGQGGAVEWRNKGLRSNLQAPPEGTWTGHPSALKSALQKAVRRGMAPAACRIALQMLKEDPGELLRRLPIICLEDTTAHPTLLPVSVWLMCAQAKGFQLGTLHASAVMDFVYQMACVGIRDHLPNHPPTLCPGRTLQGFATVDEELPLGHGLHQESVLCKAMLLRAQYGGMSSDVEACKGYAQLWTARFSASSNKPSPAASSKSHPSDRAPAASAKQQPTPETTTPPLTRTSTPSPFCTLELPPAPLTVSAPTNATHCVLPPLGQQESVQGSTHQLVPTSWFAYIASLYSSLPRAPPELACIEHVGPLRKADVPLAAIDFHVSSIIDHLLQDVPQVAGAAQHVCGTSWGIEGDAEAQLKNAMWLFMSSVNHRAWLPFQRRASAPPPSASEQLHLDLIEYHHQPLAVDLEQEAAQRDRLKPLWEAAQKAQASYANSLISKRFQVS